MIFGYLDAGTGSLVLQLLAGGLAGVAAFVKYRWGSIRTWLRRGEESEQADS